MIQVISEVTLDVAQLNYFDAIVTKQYDRETRFLRVHLTSNGEPITVDSDSSAIINARRPDKTSKSFMGTVESDGSSVLVPIAYWMVEQDGTVCCDVSVVQNTGVLTTMSFELSVQEAMNSNNDDSVTDDDKYGVLVSLIAEVSSFKTAEQQRVEAEQQRVEAEQARESWKKDTAEEVSGWATTVKETLDNAKLEVKNLEDAIGSSAESADKAAAHLQATKEYFEQVRTITIGAQGWYATPEALKAAVPVGENGWWAVVGTTDTIWTWDSDTGAWVDTQAKVDLSDYLTQTQIKALLAGYMPLRAATTTVLGGIKVGDNLSIDTDGKLNGAAPYTLTADKITTALGFAPTRVISSTDAPPADLSAYPDGTLWIVYKDAASDEAVDDTDIHMPADETGGTETTDTAEPPVLVDADGVPEEG